MLAPAAAAREHDVMALLGFAVERRNIFRPVLEIAVHDHRPIARGMIEPRRDPIMLSEITAELKSADASIGLRELLDDLPGSVPAAVFDEDYLKIFGDSAEGIAQSPIEFIEAAFGAIDRHDDAYMSHSTRTLSSKPQKANFPAAEW